jgi:hypothetical protein
MESLPILGESRWVVALMAEFIGHIFSYPTAIS